MRALAAVAALAAALLLAAGPADAAPPACAGSNLLAELRADDPAGHAGLLAEAAAVANGEGLLWRVEGGGTAPSYLFGTIHVTEPRVTDLPATLTAALDRVGVVAVESVEALDPEDFARNIERYRRYFLYADGGRLADRLDAAQRAVVAQELGRIGIGLDAAGAMKPWMLATALGVPACEAARRKEHAVVDAVIADEARRRGLSLVGLETTEEQLAAFDAIPSDLQVEYLISSARLAPRLPDLFVTLADLYLQRRAGVIHALSRRLGRQSGLSEAAYLAFNDRLIDRRNETMLARARPLLERGGALIAVGALHLPGERGLVALMRDAGYSVTRVD